MRIKVSRKMKTMVQSKINVGNVIHIFEIGSELSEGLILFSLVCYSFLQEDIYD
jgi:hypothetical protein